MALDSLPAGELVFLDSTIFICHFAGQSNSSTRLLLRCEAGEVKGTSSVVVLAETAHRLMMVEEISRKLVAAGNVARKLREHPEVISNLKVYQQQVERIPLMGIRIVSLDLRVWLGSAGLRAGYGLMTTDSIVTATAIGEGITNIASSERHFARVEKLTLHVPTDLPM